jgi:hypothetical protein
VLSANSVVHVQMQWHHVARGAISRAYGEDRENDRHYEFGEEQGPYLHMPFLAPVTGDRGHRAPH